MAVGEHFADHFPGDLDEAVLDEVEADVHVVLVQRSFKCNLVKLKSVKRLLVRQSAENTRVFHHSLNLWVCSLQLIRPRQNDLKHVFIEVTHAKVQVKQGLRRVGLQRNRQQGHLFLGHGDLVSSVLLRDQSFEIRQILVGLVFLLALLHLLSEVHGFCVEKYAFGATDASFAAFAFHILIILTN